MAFFNDRVMTLRWVIIVALLACTCSLGLAREPEHPFPRRQPAPELKTEREWFNTEKPLALRDLRGKFVLLDFWTYCCINCMHILPELAKLEVAFPIELVVIGVHSATFDEEKLGDHIREARRMLAEQKPDFEFDGEMSADVALNPELQKLYPFMGLSGPANVLVMPALHSANLSSKLLQELGAGTVIGPLLSGLERSVQIVPMNAGASDLVNMAALAAFGSDLI